MAEELTKISEYLSFASKTITEKVTSFLSNAGWNVSVRWTSLLTLFLSLLIIFLGLKIAKPIVKAILIIVGIILLLGLLIPW